ncbi:CC42M protein, partial [Thinocorus orbignyianus]|nr:CC42M protein [Thinocorus orbignyianus]
QEFRQRMECLVQRRQQLGQREEQLRQVVLKFDAFLKVLGRGPWGWAGHGGGHADPVPLPQAAAPRQERAWQQARAAGQEAEITRLRQELEGLLQLREHLARRLRSLRRFEDYLQGVLARTGQFQDIPAMLAHFGAVVETRAALAQQAEARQEQLSQDRALLRGYQEEASSEILRTQDELTQLRARLEAAHHQALQQESHWAHLQSTGTQKTLLLGQIKLAVLNLFQLATTRLKVPTDVALEDTEAQLDTVLLCMQDLAVSCAQLCPGEPGPCPPRLSAATSTRPLRRGGRRVPPGQE